MVGCFMFFFFLFIHILLILSVRLAWLNFASLFYYLAYFCYYSWVPLPFYVLFTGPTVLIQLTFTFYLKYFQQKIFSSAK